MATKDRARASSTRWFAAASTLTLSTLACPGVAAAQPSSAAVVLDDIVVTATRSDQRLSRVPASISALSPEALEKQNIKTVADLQGIVPGLRFSSGGNTITIRGISSSAPAPTTGVYIDDTPIQMLNVGDVAQNTVPELFDLERIEVLRGPQGTLFGAGALGGVVRYITPAPSLTSYSGHARAELGFIKEGDQVYEVGAAFGGPVVEDKIGVRGSIYYRHTGGWVDHLDYRNGGRLMEPDYNYNDAYSARLAVAFAPTEQSKVTLSVFHQDRNGQGSSSLDEYYAREGRATGNIKRYATATPSVWPEKDRFYLPSLKVEYDFGSVQFLSNSSIFYRNQLTSYDATGYNVRLLNSFRSMFLPGIPRPLATTEGLRIPIDYSHYAMIKNRHRNYTQEFRLQSNNPDARLTWVVGFFWARNETRNFHRQIDPQFDDFVRVLTGMSGSELLGGAKVGPGGIDSYFSDNKYKDGQVSGFGEANFLLTDKLKLTAGLRYSKTHLSYTNVQDGPINGGPSSGDGRQSEKPVAPKVGVSYQADENNLYYGTIAKGFRIGGANAPIPEVSCREGFEQLGLPGAPETYDSDTTVSYELGSKNRLMDGRLQVAASVFHIDWKNIQQATTIPVCAFRYTANVATAQSRGFDVQLTARPTDSLTLDVQAGYNDARYTEQLRNGAGGIIVDEGDTLGGPNWTVALAGQYDFAVLERESFVRLEYRYASKNDRFLPINNPVTTTYDATIPKAPATTYMTARAGMNFDKFDAAVFIDNLLDSSKLLTRSRSSRTWPVYQNSTWRPRTIVFALSYRY
jgi:iron complex outermembrane receptor protein